MKNALSLAVVSGLASSALATSTISVLASVNGGPFASSNIVFTGDVVRARVECQTDLPTAVGLAGGSFNVAAANFSTASALRAWSFSSPSSGPLGPGVQDQVNGKGRIAPFAASASTRVPTSSLSAGTLTISGTGTGGRIAIGQNAPSLAGTRFNPNNGVAVFQFTFTVGGDYNLGDVMTITVTNFLNQSATGPRWYDNLAGTTAINDPNPIFQAGTLTYVPAPNSLALLGLGGLATCRRRRGAAHRTPVG